MRTRRPEAPFLLAPHAQTEIRARDGHTHLCIARVGAGVVCGRMRRGSGSAHADTWTLFETREQFDACADGDALRFADPLLFQQLKKEFDHAFDQHRQVGVRLCDGLEPGPGDARADSD